MDQLDVVALANKDRYGRQELLCSHRQRLTHPQQSPSVSGLPAEYDLHSPNWCSTVNQCGGIRSLVSIFRVENHGFGATTGVTP